MSVNETLHLTPAPNFTPYVGFKLTQNPAFAYLVLFSCVICNSNVIYLALVRLRKANLLRNSNLLVSHMALASILFFTSAMFVTTEKQGMVDTPEELCAVVSYTKRLFHSVYLSNAFAFTYERLSAIRKTQSSTKLGWILAAVWSVSLVFSVPSAFITVSNTYYQLNFESNFTANSNISVRKNCRAINLLDSEKATLAYEFARLVLFGIVNSSYMLYAVFKIRSIVKNIRRVQGPALTPRMARKLRSVRVIYVIFTLFVLISVPNEIRIFLRRVLARNSFQYLKSSGIQSFLWSPCAFAFYLGGYLYTILMPLVSLVMLEGKAVFGLTGSGDASSGDNRNRASGEKVERRLEACTSRVSTANNSPSLRSNSL